MDVVDRQPVILVGVPVQERLSEGTVEFVVRQARDLAMGVDLVHVVPTQLGGLSGGWDAGAALNQLESHGRENLEEAVYRIRHRLAGDQPVSGELVRGGVIQVLLDRSRHAQLVVLEHREATRWERFTHGSVSTSVAARAHAPVVSVPAAWRPPTRPLPVVVAVNHAERADAEVWTALGVAAAADLPVHLLSVAYLAAPYSEELLHGAVRADLLAEARSELEHAVALPDSVRARIPVSFDVAWGKPADVLVRASDRCSLMVLARRDPRLPFGSHLGPVVRHVLRQAMCPVLVVEPSLPEPVLPTDLSTQGDITRTASPTPVG